MSLRVAKTLVSSIVLLSMLCLIVLGAGERSTRTLAAPPASPPLQSGPITPFQAAMQNAVAERQAQGLAAPVSVTYDNEAATGPVEQGPAIQGLQAQAAVSSVESNVITATTTVTFDTPQQAGYDQWPQLSAADFPPGAVVPSGDPNEMLKRLAEENLPGIWDQRAYGSEPRRYTFTETITYSAGGSIQNTMPLASTNATVEDILMGFTMSGPDWDYSLRESIDICIPLLWPPWYKCWEVASVRAGFTLDWGFGLRLPGVASMEGPAQAGNGRLQQRL